MNEKVKKVVAFMKENEVTIEELNVYYNDELKKEFVLTVDCYYDINGVVVTGKVDAGYLCKGMNLELIGEKTRILCTCFKLK